MSYYNQGKNIKETVESKTIAIATFERGAEIIVKALNYYFDEKLFTGNQCVEMMHNNDSKTLKKVADLLEKDDSSKESIVEYLTKLSEEIAAQALVVSMRDELKFDGPKILKKTKQ